MQMRGNLHRYRVSPSRKKNRILQGTFLPSYSPVLKNAGYGLLLTQLSVAVEVRLVSGSNAYEGRVELFYDGNWGTICDTTWNIDAATVICRMLGKDRAIEAPNRSRFGKGCGEIMIQGLHCSGREETLLDCRHSGFKSSRTCGHDNDVGVVCDQGHYSGNLENITGHLLKN